MGILFQRVILVAIGLLAWMGAARADYPTRAVQNPYTETNEVVPYNPCTGTPLIYPRGNERMGFVTRVDVNPYTGMIRGIAGAGILVGPADLSTAYNPYTGGSMYVGLDYKPSKAEATRRGSGYNSYSGNDVALNQGRYWQTAKRSGFGAHYNPMTGDGSYVRQ
jgi:hypothetical protein